MLSTEDLMIIIATDLATKHLSVNELMKSIDSAEKPEEVVSEFDEVEDGLLHLLLSKAYVNEDEIITFVKKYSAYLNPNRQTKTGETALHVMAQKDMLKLSALVLSGELQFASKPNLYAKNESGKTPAEMAGVLTNDLFKEVMQDDFMDRVVLVTSFATDSVFNYLMDNEFETVVWTDSEPNARASVIKAIAEKSGLIADDGTIGKHLDFAGTLYDKSFVDRPHSHWTWNHLCHPNIGGSWEEALIAVIDPLTSFKNVEGIVPYDTTVMGPHRLSEQSIILVPNDAVPALTKRLKEEGNFLGTIQGYDPSAMTLRQALEKAMKTTYPKAATLFNHKAGNVNGAKITKPTAGYFGYDFTNGYFDELFMQFDGNLEALMKGRGTICLPAYQEYSQGRHVGMHTGSVSDIEKNSILLHLKEVSTKPDKLIEKMPYLIGREGNKKISQLCTVEAYKVYQRLHHYSEETGAHDYAEYLLKKAIIADFRAYHYQVDAKEPALDSIKLKQMVDESFEGLVAALEKITHHGADLTEYRATMAETYTKVLTPPKSTIVKEGVKFSIWTEEPVQLPAQLQRELEHDQSANPKQTVEEQPTSQDVQVFV